VGPCAAGESVEMRCLGTSMRSLAAGCALLARRLPVNCLMSAVWLQAALQ
jgi:hypothetical protein